MKHTIELNLWVWLLWFAVTSTVIVENFYFSTVINGQRHTIQQLMGRELGPHDTPRPKDELPLSSAPNPATRSI